MSTTTTKKPIVLITGVTGYIGAHVTLEFLKDDKYQVRGSVRNPASEKSQATLKEAFGDELYAKLELVPLELTKPEQFAAAVKGVTYVVHVASPFPTTNPEDENLVIKPALEGTLNMLKACAGAESSVKRVCVTSSNYATLLMDLEDRANYPKEIDESCWSDETLPYLDPYQKSKIISEKAAWKYWGELPQDTRYDMTTVLPGYVMGPPLASGMSGNSISFCLNVLNGGAAMLPRIGFPACDVRDVAVAHKKAIDVDEAQGKRFCLCSETQTLLMLAQKVNDAVGESYGLPKMVEMEEEMGKKAVGPFWDLFPVYKKPDRATTILGVEYTPVAQTMKDMATTLIAKGYVKEKLSA